MAPQAKSDEATLEHVIKIYFESIKDIVVFSQKDRCAGKVGPLQGFCESFVRTAFLS